MKVKVKSQARCQTQFDDKQPLSTHFNCKGDKTRTTENDPGIFFILQTQCLILTVLKYDIVFMSFLYRSFDHYQCQHKIWRPNLHI